MRRDSCAEERQEQGETRNEQITIEALITEQVRRSGFDGPAGYNVPRRKVEAAAQQVLDDLMNKPGGLSPEESQALFRYAFKRLGWV